MGILLWIMSSVYLLVALRIFILTWDKVDEIKDESPETPMWMWFTTCMINALTWPLGLVMFLFGGIQNDGNSDFS